MEKWLYKKYKNPFLDIDSVHIFNNKNLTIKSKVNDFDVEITNDESRLLNIKYLLEDLRDPLNPSWINLKNDENINDITSDLLNMLDEQLICPEFNGQ